MLVNGKMVNRSGPFVSMKDVIARTGNYAGYVAFQATLAVFSEERPEEDFVYEPCQNCQGGCEECYGTGSWGLLKPEVAAEVIERAYASIR